MTPLRARRSSPPNPGWARVAATYAPLAPPDGSRTAANDDTLTAVGPLLAIATLALLLLAFVVLALSV